MPGATLPPLTRLQDLDDSSLTGAPALNDALLGDAGGKWNKAQLTTGIIGESGNLYYTNARADARITVQKGAANGLATLDSGGQIPSAQIPPLGITEVTPVPSQAAMLALPAQRGDVAIRTDTNTTYILATDSPTTLADWKQVLTPGAGVTSVNGDAGPSVVLTTSNITEGGNQYYTNARARAAISAGSPLTYNSGTGLLGIQVATGAQDGYLSSGNWTTFNNKQAALGFTPVNKAGDNSVGPLGLGGAAYGQLSIPIAPVVTANNGLINIGGAPFDGVTTGFFVGNSAANGGTYIAGNSVAAFTGNYFDFQQMGVMKSRLTVGGNLTIQGLTMPTGATNGFYLKTDGAGVASWAAVSGSGSPYTAQQQFQFTGSASNDATQDSIQVKPSGAYAANYRGIAVYNGSSATTPIWTVRRDGSTCIGGDNPGTTMLYIVGNTNTSGNPATWTAALVIDNVSGSSQLPIEMRVAGTRRAIWRCDTGGNLIFSGTGTGAMYLGYDSGTNGVVFGSGGQTEVAYINGSGYAVFGNTSTNLNTKAALQADSTTRGFMPPRMTTTQKNAITSPPESLVVYDLTLHKLCVYTGAAWETITSA